MDMNEFLGGVILIVLVAVVLMCGCLSALICVWAEEEGKIPGNLFSTINLLLAGLFVGITVYLYERFVIRPFNQLERGDINV